jgi:hypothetical protein
MSHWSEKQTDDPHYADEHNFYKVEAWSRDDQHIVVMLYAGSSPRHLRLGSEASPSRSADDPPGKPRGAGVAGRKRSLAGSMVSHRIWPALSSLCAKSEIA